MFNNFQYTTGKDGSTVGVTVTRNGALSHCRTLTVACNYTEGMKIFVTVIKAGCIYKIGAWKWKVFLKA